MTWAEYTWQNDAGLEAFVDFLSETLTNHPAWEFVEETVEKMTVHDGGTPGIWYDMLTFPIQVWKCLGTANGTGQDFYVAFTRTISDNPISGPGEGGYFITFMAEEYNATTHTATNVTGKYTYSAPFVLNADGEFEAWKDYPWLQPKVEAGGTTWGYWGSPGNAETADLELTYPSRGTQHPMGQTGGRSASFPTFYDSDAEKPTGTYTAHWRVSNQGIFIAFQSSEGDGTWEYPTWLGLYETAVVLEQLTGPVPIFQLGPDDGVWGGQNLSLISFSRHLGFPEGAGSPSSWHSGVDYYGYSFTDSGEGTTREQFPYPSLAPYVALPWGLSLYEEANIQSEMGYPLYQVPGIWLLSHSGNPSAWTAPNTTIEHAELEHQCRVMIFGTYPSTWAVDIEAV